VNLSIIYGDKENIMGFNVEASSLLKRNDDLTRIQEGMDKHDPLSTLEMEEEAFKAKCADNEVAPIKTPKTFNFKLTCKIERRVK
jgi:hypothetical protein